MRRNLIAQRFEREHDGCRWTASLHGVRRVGLLRRNVARCFSAGTENRAAYPEADPNEIDHQCKKSAAEDDDDWEIDADGETALRRGRHEESIGRRAKRTIVVPSEADLQLTFARLNYEYFNGEVPDCRIRYNARFSNSAGRITYGVHPLLIELSPKHFAKYPQALHETLLHEMIHAWCFARWRDTGHGARFKKKLRECGLTSIYHDLGNVAPRAESGRRYILRCDQCAFETLRRKRPSKPASCPRCNKQRFDPRYPLTILQITGVEAVGTTLDGLRAAQKGNLR